MSSDRMELLQDDAGFRSKRNLVRSLHFHFRGRDRPNGRIEVKFAPFGGAQFAGTDK